MSKVPRFLGPSFCHAGLWLSFYIWLLTMSSLKAENKLSVLSLYPKYLSYISCSEKIWSQLSSVQPLSRVQLFATPWIAALQGSLSITNSQSLLKCMSIESVMPSNHLILWCPLLLLPSIFPSIRVFSNESVLCIRWPKYWSFSFTISPSNEYSDWFLLG